MPLSTTVGRAAVTGSLSLLALALAASASVAPAAVVAASVGASPADTGGPPRVPVEQVSPMLAGAGTALFSCQKPTAPTHCYAPEQVRHAYQVDSLIASGLDGRGKTIVIVDPYQSPTVRQDLTTFDSTFGLPEANLTVIAPDGRTSYDPKDTNQVGWASEISLDVQWAHAIAPQSDIALVLAKTNTDSDIQSALAYAVDHDLGDVISQSFGEAEACYGVNVDGIHQPGTTLAAQHAIFVKAQRKGMTVLAAAGDSGSAQPTCDGKRSVLAASTPATDPL